MEFKIEGHCETCNGTGKAILPIQAEDILAVVLNNYNTDGATEDLGFQKIPAIRQLREQYPIGLKDAKELVERSLAYIDSLHQMGNVSIPVPYMRGDYKGGASN